MTSLPVEPPATVASVADRRLTLSGVSMRFGDFYAVRDLDLSFEPGKVHAVVGQNGAGKTTFARVVCGLYTPTSGTVMIGETQLRSGSVTAAREQGVDMVHQHFTSPPSMTIAETLEFFSANKSPFFGGAALARKWQKRIGELGFDIDVRRRVRDLSVPERQSVEIVRALSNDTRVLLFDEPTASMPAQAIDALLARIRSLAASGLTIIVVLHKLAEVFAVADTVTVLNKGRVTLPKTPISAVSGQDVTSQIIGDANVDSTLTGLAAGDAVRFAHTDTGEVDHDRNDVPVLEIRGLATESTPIDAALNNFDLTIRAGEIVGIAGVEGNGQVSLVEALVGVRGMRGTMSLDGREIGKASVIDRRRHGLRVIPFERNVEGVSASSALWENLGIASVLRSRRRFLSARALRLKTRERLTHWGVSYRTVDQTAGELSGGNIQRLILGREIDDSARLVIAAQPTRGLDVGAIAFVQQSLAGIAATGGAVLLVSTDLDELRGLSDRIIVLRGGSKVAELPPTADLHSIGAAMLGGTQ